MSSRVGDITAAMIEQPLRTEREYRRALERRGQLIAQAERAPLDDDDIEVLSALDHLIKGYMRRHAG